jgi:glutathione S-transferase
MADVEILGIPPSTYTWAVRMVCEEKGIPYDLKPTPPKTPEAIAVHPLGKIPGMRHGDVELFESKAIATYLDRVFPGPKIMPEDPRLAALAEQWISLVNTVTDGVLVRRYVLPYVFPQGADGKPDRAAIDAIIPAMREHIALLEKGVSETGYLAGDQYTFADINVMPILHYVRQFPEGAAAMQEAPNLSDYYARNAQRPSFQKTIP